MGSGLTAARLQCHHAVQLNTRVARALVPARAIRPGAAVIDFGTNVVAGKMVGDVEPEAADRAAPKKQAAAQI